MNWFFDKQRKAVFQNSTVIPIGETHYGNDGGAKPDQMILDGVGQ